MENVIILVGIFILFLAVAMFWYQMLGLTPEESMLMSAVLIMIITFMTGLINNIQNIYWICAAFGVVGISMLLFNMGKPKECKGSVKERILCFFSPAVIVVIGVFLFSLIAFHNTLFVYPDEVYQWGSSLKYMSSTHGLPCGEGFTGQEVTLSFCTMFQYIWVGIGKFVESNGFIGNFLLTFIPIMLPFSGCKWKQWKEVFVYSIIVFLAFNLLSYVNYYTLLQDRVLPMWAGGIIAWLLWSKESENKEWFLLISLIAVGAMKSLVGPLFAGMIIVTYFYSQFYKSGKKWKSILKLKHIFLLIAPFLVNIIWSSFITQNVLDRGVGAAEKSWKKIILGIVKQVFAFIPNNKNSLPYLSYAIYFVICIISAFILKKVLLEGRQKQYVIAILKLYLLGFIGYIFIMIYAYGFVFGAEDGNTVAGLNRYLSYYMLVGLLPFLVPLFNKNIIIKKRQYIVIIQLMLLLFCLWGTGGEFLKKVSFLDKEESTAYKNRISVKKVVEVLNELIQSDKEKILVAGEMTTNDSKIYMYELEERFRADRDIFKIYYPDFDKTTICTDVQVILDVFEEGNYKYLLFLDTVDRKINSEELKNIIDYYNIDEIENGDLYHIVKEKAVYLGNVL